MYGLTRGTITLIGAGVAGFLVWLATRVVGDRIDTNGDFWAAVILLAAAGLVMALSQLLGGWTKWGWPRLSGSVFMIAFLPVLITAGWVLAWSQTDSSWLRRHVRSWSDDIGIDGVVGHLGQLWPVLAIGLGLVYGLTFDTTGPRTEPLVRRRQTVVAEEGRMDEPGAVARDVPPVEEPPPAAAERDV